MKRGFIAILSVMVVVLVLMGGCGDDGPNQEQVARLTALTTTTNSTPGSHTWTVPAGVTSITVEAWGGGGAGGGRTSAGQSGGGGGGAYARRTFSVTPGSNISYYVAPATTGIASGGTAGQATWFLANNASGLVASGGLGGFVTGTGGLGGSTANCHGDVTYRGGNAGNAAGGSSGGGGGGAGSTGQGKDASGATAGGTTADNGGTGGPGRSGNGNGSNGDSYGGGGGGASTSGSASKAGGNGAQGLIRITYTACTVPTANFSGNVTSGCAPLTVQFTDTSTGSGITSWNWIFPGGSPSSAAGQGPHVVNYASVGNYTVSLNVSNACGWDVKTENGYITVVATCVATAPDFSISKGTTVDDALFTGHGASCSGGCNITLSYGFDGSAAGVYSYNVTCDNGICSPDVATGSVMVLECCVAAAPDFSISKGTTVDDALFTGHGASCSGGCNMTLSYGFDGSATGVYSYNVTCDNGVCSPDVATGSVMVVECCVATAPDFSISKGTTVDDALFTGHGASCSGGCNMTLSYGFDGSAAGVYSYNVTCDNGVCSPDVAMGSVMVVECCVTTAPDFSISKGTTVDDALFTGHGASCSGGCNMTLSYGFDGSATGVYSYNVTCDNGVCSPDVATGSVTVVGTVPTVVHGPTILPHLLHVGGTEGGTVAKPIGGSLPYGAGSWFAYYPGTVVDLVATPDAGYRFINWSGTVGAIADVNAASTTITMNGDYAVIANFARIGEAEINQYNLTPSSTSGGSVTTPGEETFVYDAGAVVNLVAKADSGYMFVRWTGDVTTIANVNGPTTSITMNDDYSIVANFAQIPPSQVALIVSSSDGGSVTSPGEATFTYNEGTVVDLKAEPEEGYQFVRWIGDVGTIADVTVGTTTITMDDDYSITAVFKFGTGCFIATAAYGSPMAEEIQILRDFRDEYMLTNPVGEALVNIYYRVSPPIAEFITEHPSLRLIVRAELTPIVAVSTVAVNTSPAEKVAIAGLSVVLVVAVAIWVTRRRGKSQLRA